MSKTDDGSRTNVRVIPRLDPAEVLAWLSGAAGSAMAFVATCVSGCPVLVEMNADGEVLLTTAATRALFGEEMRTLFWHAEGEAPVGSPIAIVGVAAEHRQQAFAAIDMMLARFKGVAKRTDLEGELPGSPGIGPPKLYGVNFRCVPQNRSPRAMVLAACSPTPSCFRVPVLLFHSPP